MDVIVGVLSPPKYARPRAKIAKRLPQVHTYDTIRAKWSDSHEKAIQSGEQVMEISKSINFITEDPRWQQKLLIGTGVVIASTILSSVIIGIVGFLILAGYSVRLTQNVRDGEPYPLPEWDQWGDDLTRGFKLTVAGLVWALPIFIFTIPLIIGSALADSRSDGAQVLGSLILMCGGCLVTLYSLFIGVISPAITIAFAKDEQIKSGLQFREIIEWTRANIGQVLVVMIVVIAASFVISIVGAIAGVLLCLVGLAVTMPLATLLISLFQYHLFGQLAYSYPYPVSGSGPVDPPIDPTLAAYTPPTDMAPGVAPLAPSDEPIGDTTDYPDSGVDNPAPPPAA